MADYLITGRVWDDADGDGTQGGEGGLSGRSVNVFRQVGGMDTLVSSKFTDVNGEYSTGTDLFGLGSAETFTVSAFLLLGWEPTTPASVELNLTAASPSGEANFGQWQSTRTCFRAPSSWVHEVCWVPGRGVQLTYHNRDLVPCFACYYPGTTLADYQHFVHQASLGRWAWAMYFTRPYVPVPVGS